jgi:hypothetical protein
MKNLFLIGTILLAILSGCNSDADKKIDPELLTFGVSDESKLYFKNVRQSDYDFDDESAVGVHIYRLKKRNKEAEYPVLNLVLAHNWRNDVAYLLFEPNRAMVPDTTVLENATFIFKSSGSEPEILEYSMENMKNLSASIATIYNAILDKKTVYWMRDGEETLLFNGKAEEDAFRITCYDYYKLINAFN